MAEMENSSPVPSPRQLRAIRGWFGWNRGEAADRLGVSSSTIYEYEVGKQAVADASLAIITLKLQGLDVRINNGDLILPA